MCRRILCDFDIHLNGRCYAKLLDNQNQRKNILSCSEHSECWWWDIGRSLETCNRAMTKGMALSCKAIWVMHYMNTFNQSNMAVLYRFLVRNNARSFLIQTNISWYIWFGKIRDSQKLYNLRIFYSSPISQLAPLHLFPITLPPYRSLYRPVNVFH